MVAIELRLGNWVLNHNIAERVTIWHLQVLFYNQDNQFRPIPLSDEILLKSPEITKCTWRKTRYNIRYEDGQFHLDILNGRFIFRGLGMSIVYVDTLHHLQNLVFVTSGKELEIEL